MPTTIGTVTLNDEPTKAKLYRFCEKKIDQWLESQLGQMNLSSQPEGASAEFNVSILEENNQFSCETEIHLGGSHWRGCDLACDAQQALIHSLRRLRPH
jgi:hypothetical protein